MRIILYIFLLLFLSSCNNNSITNTGIVNSITNTGIVNSITNTGIVNSINLSSEQKFFIYKSINNFDIKNPKNNESIGEVSPDEFEIIFEHQINGFLSRCISLASLKTSSDNFLELVSDGNLSIYNYLKIHTEINKIMTREEVMKFNISEFNYETHLGYLYKLGRITEKYYNEQIDLILLNYKDYNRFNTYNLNDQDLKIIVERDVFLGKIENPENYCKKIITLAIK